MKRKKNGEMTFIQKVVKYRILLLMCLPAIVFFFLFNYVPLPGIYVAFVKYNYRDGIFGSKFVGLQNFKLREAVVTDQKHDPVQYRIYLVRKFPGGIRGDPSQ